MCEEKLNDNSIQLRRKGTRQNVVSNRNCKDLLNGR